MGKNNIAKSFFIICLLIGYNLFSQPVRTIPVVFHIVHHGEPYGVGYNLDDTQIRNMLKYMNETYRRKTGTPGYGHPVFGVDTKIQFVLAGAKNPGGTSITGIERIDGRTITGYTQFGLVTSGYDKPFNLSAFSPYRYQISSYVNIFVVSKGEEFAFGGINLLKSVFLAIPYGNPDPELAAKILNHEMGHYLGLDHTFEDYNEADSYGCPVNTDCHTQGDRICDTPPHINGMVPPESCSHTGDPFFDTSYYWNIMSYDDMLSFTPDQKEAMNDYLDRPDMTVLWSSDNLAVAAVKFPVAAISVKDNLCNGAPANFSYAGSGQPDVLKWEFDGGTPAVSAELNPVVHFTYGGLHTVKLTVSNALGLDTKTISVYVTPPAMGSFPYAENFSVTTFPPYGCQVTGTDTPSNTAWGINGNKTWVRQNGMLAINTYHYPSTGQADQFILPVVPLYDTKNPKLTFRVAYANYPNRNDRLNVYAKKNCETSFTLLYTKAGTGLSTAGISSTPFTPAYRDDWRTETIDLSGYASQAVTIKFEAVTDYGNNIYIDGIDIQAYPSIQIKDLSLDPCSPSHCLFAAVPTDGGTNPFYKWFVDGVEQQDHSSFFEGNFDPGQAIYCMMTPNHPDGSLLPVKSNTIAVRSTKVLEIISLSENINISIQNEIIYVKGNGSVRAKRTNSGQIVVPQSFMLFNRSYTDGYTAGIIFNDFSNCETGDILQAIEKVPGDLCPNVSPEYYIVMLTAKPASIDDDDPGTFSVYPNPAQTEVNLLLAPDLAKTTHTIIIINPLGQEVFRLKANGSENQTVDIGSLASGLYILSLHTNDGHIITQRLLKD